jgi:hypothetical protein
MDIICNFVFQCYEKCCRRMSHILRIFKIVLQVQNLSNYNNDYLLVGLTTLCGKRDLWREVTTMSHELIHHDGFKAFHEFTLFVVCMIQVNPLLM